MLSVPGKHTVENIRLVSKGQVVLYGSPEVATIDVIEKLLVTTVTTRALTADEIREKGIVFDKTNFQAYNFTAAFAIDDGSKIDITFPVVLPTLLPPQDVNPATVDLASVNPPQLQSLKTLIPDTLRIQQRIPNLSVVGFTLTLDSEQPQSQSLALPPIPGVIVIPGDIGFLNQYFSVMLMVSNVAPTGSMLVVTDLMATIVLPAGNDNVVGSDDDPLRMATRAAGEFPRLVAVTQPGPDGKLGTGDDVTVAGARPDGQRGVPGRRASRGDARGGDGAGGHAQWPAGGPRANPRPRGGRRARAEPEVHADLHAPGRGERGRAVHARRDGHQHVRVAGELRQHQPVRAERQRRPSRRRAHEGRGCRRPERLRDGDLPPDLEPHRQGDGRHARLRRERRRSLRPEDRRRGVRRPAVARLARPADRGQRAAEGVA